MLARNSQCRSIFHQSHITDVGNFRTTDALVDPTYHITQDTLGVVIEFLLNILVGPVWPFGNGNSHDIADAGAAASL